MTTVAVDPKAGFKNYHTVSLRSNHLNLAYSSQLCPAHNRCSLHIFGIAICLHICLSVVCGYVPPPRPCTFGPLTFLSLPSFCPQPFINPAFSVGILFTKSYSMASLDCTHLFRTSRDTVFSSSVSTTIP